MRVLGRCDLFRRAGGDDLAATVTTLGAKVDDPVGGLDDIEVVLDDHHGVAVFAQSMQYAEQLLDVVEMQAGGWLVQNIQGAPGVSARQLARQLYPLRLAARKGGRRLPKLDVREAYRHQRFQLAGNAGHRLEQGQRIFHGHFQHVVDGMSLVGYGQGFAVVAFAVANIAGHVDVGQEVHFDLDQTVALTGLAAPALDVEAEAPRRVTASAGFGHLSKQFPQRGKQTGVGGRIAARRAADGRLVDVYHLIEQIQSANLLERGGLLAGAIEVGRGQPIQGVVDQGRFARDGNAGNADEQPGWYFKVDVLKIVAMRANQL